MQLCERKKMTHEELMAMKQCILLWRQREQMQETRLLQEIKNEEEEYDKLYAGDKSEKICEEMSKKAEELINLRKEMSKMQERLQTLLALRYRRMAGKQHRLIRAVQNLNPNQRNAHNQRFIQNQRFIHPSQALLGNQNMMAGQHTVSNQTITQNPNLTNIQNITQNQMLPQNQLLLQNQTLVQNQNLVLNQNLLQTKDMIKIQNQVQGAIPHQNTNIVDNADLSQNHNLVHSANLNHQNGNEKLNLADTMASNSSTTGESSSHENKDAVS